MIHGGKREVAKMAWPLAVGMLSFTLMSVADTLFMGYVGTTEQAGVGLATTLFFFFLSFFYGLLTGSQSLVAAAFGAKDDLRIKHAGSAGVIIGLFSAISALMLLALVYKPLLELTVPDDGIINSASAYLEMRLFGMPFSLIGLGLLSGIQGLGDTKTRMYVALCGNCLNVVLDYLFIFGAGPIAAMHEEGAALATVISSILMASMYVLAFLRKFGRPVIPPFEVIASSIKVGLPTGIQRLLDVTAFAVMNLVLARVGAVHLAASEIVLNIISVSFLPGYGIGEAGGILIGRYLGAGEPEKAGRSLRSARYLAIIVMGFCGLMFAIHGEWIAGFFTRDAEVAKIAGALMLYAALFQVLDALATVHLCALRGAGDTRFSLFLTTAASWGVFLPVTLVCILVYDLGAEGGFIAFCAELIFLSMGSSLRVRGIKTGAIGRLDLLLGEKTTAVAD